MKVLPSLGQVKRMALSGVPFSMLCYVVAFVTVAGWRRGLLAYFTALVVSAVGGGAIGGFVVWQDAKKKASEP